MLKLNIDLDKLWFTSDTHFLHSKNLVYSGRPFQTIEEHDNTLIANINSIVKPLDYLFILGDFIFTSNVEIIRDYYSRINGIKYFILGNHDLKSRLYRDSVNEMFDWKIYDSLILSIDKEIYWLSHFPYKYFTGINLHGHIHSGPTSLANEKLFPNSRRYDCGVDNNNYFPINLEQIKFKLQENE